MSGGGGTRGPSAFVGGGSLVLMTAIWGTTWAAIRVGLGGIPPFTGVALRFGIAGVLLWGLALALRLRGERLRVPWGLLAVHTTCTFCLSYGVVYWSEQWLPSGLSAVLFATFPLFVAVLAHFALPGERLGVGSALGVLVGFLGVAVIFSEDFRRLGGPGVGLAAGVMLLSPLASAVGNVAVKKWGKTVHPVPLNAGAMVTTALVMGAVATFAERGRAVHLGGASIVALLYLALFGSAVAFSLYFWLLQHMSATRLSLIAYAIPVVAVAVGAIFLDEPVTVRVLVGGALVVAGVAWAARPVRRSGAAPSTIR